MRILLTAIHGIFTGQTDPSWPDKLDAWMYRRDSQVKVLKKEYRAGPFPRWNCWVKDPLLARSLAKEIELFLTDSGQWPPAIWFVAHSNGAVIALLTAKLLIERGYRIGGLILMGAACEADIDRNGVLEWQCQGLLGAAIAYSSADDAVLAGNPPAPQFTKHDSFARFSTWLRGKALWPYGSLGRTGWLFKGAPLRSRSHSSGALTSQRPMTRWFSSGHSAYFRPEIILRTFEQVYEDVKSETEA